ncbi:hypothetical protein ABK040_001144 [Willaertia magna]
MKSSLGPFGFDKLMIKQLDDGIFDFVYSNDGATIMNNLSFTNPIAKLFVDLSLSQERLVGDGTTSVVLLACDLVLKCIEINQKQSIPIDILCNYLHSIESTCLTLLNQLEEKENGLIKGQLFEFNKNFTTIHLLLQQTLQSKYVRFEKEHLSNLIYDCFYNNKIPKIIKYKLIEGSHISKSFGFRGLVIDITNNTTIINENNLQQCKSIILIKKKQINNNYQSLDQEFWNLLSNKLKFKVLVLMEESFPFLSIDIPIDSNIVIIDNVRFKDLTLISQLFNHPIIQISSTFIDDNLFDELLLTESMDLFSNEKDHSYLKIPFSLGNIHTFILRGYSSILLKESKRSLQDAVLKLNNLLSGECNKSLCGGGGHIEFYLWSQLLRLKSIDDGNFYRVIIEHLAESLLYIPRQILISSGMTNDIDFMIQQLKNKYRDNISYCGIDLLSNEVIVENVIENGVIEDLESKKKMIQLVCEMCVSILRISEIYC